MTPTKEGVVTGTQCNVRGERSNAEAAPCSCLAEAFGHMRFPHAHGKLGALDSAPFIVTYRLAP